MHKFHPIWIVFAIILVISVALFFLNKQRDKAIHLDREIPGLGKQLELKLALLDPPAQFKGVTALTPNPPEWTKFVFTALNLSESDLHKYYDEDYIKKFGPPKLHRPVPADVYTNIYFAITIKTPDAEYMAIGASYSKETNTFPLENAGINVLRKHGSEWKSTAPPEWITFIPWKKPEMIKQIIRDQKATVNQYNKLEPL